ncbi:MAG TPA: biotin synthase [Macromonas sp.]|nr:biotin synthase [Macromonas sp.]
MNDASESSALVPGMDPVAAARWRGLARTASPWLHEEIGSRMLDRLGWIKQQPATWLHWAPLLGGLATHRRIAALYPKAQVLLAGEQAGAAARLLRSAAAASAGWWQGVKQRLSGGGPGVLPAGKPAEPVDMVWANMALHLVPDPKAVLRQWRDALRVDGFLMFSCLGPDTLRELRTLFAEHGWPVPGPELTDMHDWGDMLLEVGFTEPVMDMERLTLTYPHAERLLQDLRETGRNLYQGRFPALRGRSYRRALCEAIERGLPRDGQGQLKLTIEVVYGHAIKAPPRVKVASSSTVSVDDMRSMLRQPPRAH